MGQPSEKVLKLAHNRWKSIYEALAPELDEAIRASASEHHVACPVHGGSDGFRFFPDWKETGGAVCNSCGKRNNGIQLLIWLKGMSYTDTLKMLFDLLEDETVNVPQYAPSVHELAQARAKRKAQSIRAANAVRRVWDQSLPLTDRRAEPARLYFAGRGLALHSDADVVRFHPSLFYRDKKVGKVFLPAIVFRVRDGQGRATTLHRIYIDKMGRKAGVSAPKRLMPYPKYWRTLSGGAIRLFPAGKELGIAEGPETALAIHQATGMPVWSTISADMMEVIHIPDSVERLWVWQDKDESGRGDEAAQAACEIMWSQGREAGAWRPSLSYDPGQKSVDWLDVFNRQGTGGFPNPAELVTMGSVRAHASG